jgi:hypothetical protein
MSYFEMLRQGSPFHKVHINSERAITILPIDDGDDDWIRFQQLSPRSRKTPATNTKCCRTRSARGISRAGRLGGLCTTWLPLR